MPKKSFLRKAFIGYYDRKNVKIVIEPAGKFAKNNEFLVKVTQDAIRTNPMTNPSDKIYKQFFGVSQKGVQKLYSKATKKGYPTRELTPTQVAAFEEYRAGYKAAKAKGPRALQAFKQEQHAKSLENKAKREAKRRAERKAGVPAKKKKASAPKTKKKPATKAKKPSVSFSPDPNTSFYVPTEESDDDEMELSRSRKRRSDE
jgi:hypothetical protein